MSATITRRRRPNEFIIRPRPCAGRRVRPEKKCGTVVTATCNFPDWPGTVGWKTGFEAIKNAPVSDPMGRWEELTPAQEDAASVQGNCRRRFDRARKDMFHYLLVAHSLGVPKSFDPGPLNSVPVTISGIGDKPGGDFMMTLGSWGNGFVGPEPIQTSTIAHELGHNLWRAHSGNPFSAFEDNCNPQDLSVMNYMYQTKGLLELNGMPQVDFSHRVHDNVNENSLPAGIGPMAYRASWYAPLAGVHPLLQVVSPATKHCDGKPLTGTEEYVRVDGTGLTPPLDWNGDLNLTNDAGTDQDVTFNGTINDGSTIPASFSRGPRTGIRSPRSVFASLAAAEV